MSEFLSQQVEWEGMPVKGFSKKDLISKESGGLKLVKILSGCKYPLHRHSDKTEFAYVLEGQLQATIGENVYIGESGAFYQFPIGELHGLKNPGEADTVVLIGALKDA